MIMLMVYGTVLYYFSSLSVRFRSVFYVEVCCPQIEIVFTVAAVSVLIPDTPFDEKYGSNPYRTRCFQLQSVPTISKKSPSA
jgi:uncharacterized membrane protein